MNWLPLEEGVKHKIESAPLFKPIRITFAGKDICVVKTEEDICGISNKCPHAGAQLHYGHCNKKGIVSCPLHGYKFDCKTGKSADGNNYKITHYAFKLEEDKLYIGLR
ncbi:MAG: Rieske 2Fe-2S domain-containing protein [Sphingobacteriales bacterium]|jgi:nitrite reductase/ring-hydroxylating ferredoxin subunit|nr:Rieske 2Fe-2S domain-containing protein [Sphingobacteriales bacterium]